MNGEVEARQLSQEGVDLMTQRWAGFTPENMANQKIRGVPLENVLKNLRGFHQRSEWS
jgi:hypothetical protein